MWSGIPISRIFQFVVIYKVKGFGLINKAEVDVFLELSCFLYDPMGVGKFDLWFLCFSKSNLYIHETFHKFLKFLVKCP